MQRVGFLWDTLISFENIYKAYKRAFKSTKTDESFAFTFNVERELFLLQEQLQNNSYEPSDYRYFTVYEPKERLISIAPFRDRVVHHALVNVLEPVFEPCFIYHSYATRKNKGSHKAIEQAQIFLRQNRWYLKMDISKYFDNINHKILMQILKRKIKDPYVLALCKKIIAKAGTEKGLPIGNLTSQFWANVYLNVLDHFVKEKLCIKHYIRYMDDFCFFSNEKKQLLAIKEKVEIFLEKNLQLKIKEKVTLINTRFHGLPFLGVRIWPSYIRISQASLKRSIKKLQNRTIQYKKQKISYEKYRSSVESLLAFIGKWKFAS